MKKYDNFVSHLKVLKRAPQEDLENEFIIRGIIDKYMIQFELGWKLMKELLQYEGHSAGMTGSPREIIKAAYRCYDFMEEDVWLSMLRDRNDTSHIYDGEAAKRLLVRILAEYIPTFEIFLQAIENRYSEVLKEM